MKFIQIGALRINDLLDLVRLIQSHYKESCLRDAAKYSKHCAQKIISQGITGVDAFAAS